MALPILVLRLLVAVPIRVVALLYAVQGPVDVMGFSEELPIGVEEQLGLKVILFEGLNHLEEVLPEEVEDLPLLHGVLALNED